MNNLQAFRLIRSFGIAVCYVEHEWQIDYKRNDPRKTDGSRYFTDDRDDAIETARFMAGRPVFRNE